MSKYGREVTELICLTRDGNKDAFGVLFARTFGHLVDVARRYLIDKNDCEDVAIEAFEKALKYIHAFNARQDGYNWLCRITQNVASDYNKRALSHPTVYLEENSRVCSVDEFYNTLENRELYKRLSLLSEEERNVVYYYYWEGLTYDEIATILGRSKSMTFYLIERAKKKLKKIYGQTLNK